MSDFDLRKGGESVTTPPPDKPYTVNLRGLDGPVPVQTVPGIDPGWAYNAGKAAYGKRVSEAAKKGMEDDGTWKNWTRLTPGDWRSAKRSRAVPADDPKAGLAPTAADAKGFERILQSVLGGPEKIVVGPDGGAVLLSAAGLGAHVARDRSPFIPLLPELIEAPYEVWLNLERHNVTGRVELRKRYVKLLQLPGKDRAMYLVAQVVKGEFVGWTFVAASELAELNKQRRGKLLWWRE
ncbi:MAG: hypothetical protein LBC79_05385 [Deltaproteobacteria bacterium]|nr:hypothetical protein [Deltaproteobacteria bacterium]